MLSAPPQQRSLLFLVSRSTVTENNVRVRGNYSYSTTVQETSGSTAVRWLRREARRVRHRARGTGMESRAGKEARCPRARHGEGRLQNTGSHAGDQTRCGI